MLPNKTIKLVGPFGYDTFDAKDLSKGLVIIRARFDTIDIVTKQIHKGKTEGYFVASLCMGSLVSPPFADWYDAVLFGNFLQTKRNWEKVPISSDADIAELQSLVRSAIREFERDIKMKSG
jgi:hypothetical protein